jgi:hypothetical protein
VRVNAIAPGYFENTMGGAAEQHSRAEKQEQIITFTPMGRRGLPEQLVGPVVFLASDTSSYVTSGVLFVDGGLHGNVGEGAWYSEHELREGEKMTTEPVETVPMTAPIFDYLKR